MKIVVDTNVWISGLLWQGTPARLLRLAEHRRVTIYVSTPIIAELKRVLGYARIQRQLHKIGLSREEVTEFAMKLMTLTKDTNLEDAIAADPDDDIFLACALAAGAQYLVSGDSHLLDLGQWRGIEMVTVNDFLAQHFPEDTPQ
jgi:hypothetical protein